MPGTHSLSTASHCVAGGPSALHDRTPEKWRCRNPRAQAVAVLRLGYLLASARYATEATALVDAWRHIVLPHAMAP